MSPAFSVADYLKLIAPKLPAALVSPAALEAIAPCAAQLPGASTIFFGFESRLGTAEATADLLVCLHPEPERGRALLAGIEGGFAPRLFKNPVWQQVQTFAEAWADPASPLHLRVENVWLEFDLAAGAVADAVPSAFFGCGDGVRSTAAEEEVRWVTACALPTLQGATFSPAIGQQIERAVRVLPADAFVFQIGAMLARRARPVRICIRGISGRDIPGYLDALGWAGSSEALTSLFADIAPLADRIDLDLDIDEGGVQPKIGLEWYLFNHLRVDPRWDAFLRWLVERRLSTPEKSRALYDYPGAQHERSKGVVWPEPLRALAAAAGPKHVSTLIRSVHHIKVVYHPSAGLEAKAYLAVNHALLDTAPFTTGERALPQTQLAPVPEFRSGI